MWKYFILIAVILMIEFTGFTTGKSGEYDMMSPDTTGLRKIITHEGDTFWIPEYMVKMGKCKHKDTCCLGHTWFFISDDDSLWIEKPLGTFKKRLDN